MRVEMKGQMEDYSNTFLKSFISKNVIQLYSMILLLKIRGTKYAFLFSACDKVPQTEWSEQVYLSSTLGLVFLTESCAQLKRAFCFFGS